MKMNLTIHNIPKIKQEISELFKHVSGQNKIEFLKDLGAEIDVRKEYINFWNEE